MILKTNINDISKTLKSLKCEAEAAARKLIDNARMQAMNLEPQAIEAAKDQLDEILTNGKAMIEEMIKEQTGYTEQEARYNSLEAFRRVKEAISDGKLKTKKDRVDAQVRKPTDLKMLCKKMSDELYNSFFLNEILETVDKAKTVVAQTRDLGADAIDNMVKHMSFIQDKFKFEGNLEDIKNFTIFEIDHESVKSTINTALEQYTKDSSVSDYFARAAAEIDTGATVSSLVSELGKSKATTYGMEYDYIDDKKGTEVSMLAKGMLSTAIPTLLTLKKLEKIWRQNKDTLRDDSAARIVDLLNIDPSGEPMDSSAFTEPIQNNINGLKEDVTPEQKAKGDPEFMYDHPFLDYSSDSSVVFVSDEHKLFSELDRIYANISNSLKDCKYNPEFPLYSTSTAIDGGKVVNLRHAGNTKEELIDAIENINGGQRLLDVNGDMKYEGGIQELVLEDFMKGNL